MWAVWTWNRYYTCFTSMSGSLLFSFTWSWHQQSELELGYTPALSPFWGRYCPVCVCVCVCVCGCVCGCVCVCVCACAWVHVCVCAHLCVCVCVCAHLCVCDCVCLCVCIQAGVHACMWVHICVYACVCACVHAVCLCICMGAHECIPHHITCVHTIFAPPQVSNPRLLTSGALMTPSRSHSHQAMISRETTFRSVGSTSPPAVFDKASASPPPNNLPDIIENTTALEQMHTVGEQGSHCWHGPFFMRWPSWQVTKSKAGLGTVLTGS